MDAFSLGLCQINPTVGDIEANVARIQAMRTEAAAAGVDLMATGELSVVGYPPEDLVRKPALLREAARAVERLAAATADNGPAMIVGAPLAEEDKVYNAAFLLDGGKVTAVVRKHVLPNYGVFDEKRVFDAAPPAGPVNFRGVRLGIMICEDMWLPDVAECLAESGAEMLLVLNGSPYEIDKLDQRFNHAVARVREAELALAYVNLVGGQDELVFDGASFVLNPDYSVAIQAPDWREALIVSHWARNADGRFACAVGERARLHQGLDAIYQAMMLGLRDYVGKNGFPGVLIGLSGGIDSALSAAVAVDALGPDKVHCVMMPSRYTSRESLEDAAEAARLMGVRLDEVPIAPAVAAFDEMLAPIFAGREADVTEENIQARIRGVTLMALSNKFGYMLLTTGNKSEMSVGYATLYGDMCGGFSVLKDVYKTTVFALSDWRNENRPTGSLGPDGR